MSSKHPCQQESADSSTSRRPVTVRRVDECASLGEVFTHCLPAFGGAFLRRIYAILDEAIGRGCPLTLAIAGPVTVSSQQLSWLNPLLETGWIAYLDAWPYQETSERFHPPRWIRQR